MLKDQDKSSSSGADHSKSTNLTEVNGDVEMLSGGDMVARALEEEGVEDESFRRMRDRDSSEEDREGVEEVELKNKIRCRRH